METITRRRTLRPSTRDAKSTYKVDTKKVKAEHILRIEIDHEDNPDYLIAIFEISGQAVAELNSIHFAVNKSPGGWSFKWYSVEPKRIL